MSGRFPILHLDSHSVYLRTITKGVARTYAVDSDLCPRSRYTLTKTFLSILIADLFAKILL